MIQKSLRITSVALGVVIALVCAKPIFADNLNSLIISQIKITTSGQFITLYNSSSQTLNMFGVKIEYFNNYDVNQSTSGKVVALSGNVPAHGYFIVSDDTQPLCYQATVESASLGFSSTSGLVRVLDFNASPVGLVDDQISWVSKNAPSGVQTMPASPAFLQRSSVNGAPYINGGWQAVQPKADDPCALVTFIAPSTPVDTTSSQLLPSIPPPAVYRPATLA